MFAQVQHDELKVARMEVEELQKIDETESKQLKLLEHTRVELDRQLENQHYEINIIKNGTEHLCTYMLSER